MPDGINATENALKGLKLCLTHNVRGLTEANIPEGALYLASENGYPGKPTPVELSGSCGVTTIEVSEESGAKKTALFIGSITCNGAAGGVTYGYVKDTRTNKIIKKDTSVAGNDWYALRANNDNLASALREMSAGTGADGVIFIGISAKQIYSAVKPSGYFDTYVHVYDEHMTGVTNHKEGIEQTVAGHAIKVCAIKVEKMLDVTIVPSGKKISTKDYEDSMTNRVQVEGFNKTEISVKTDRLFYIRGVQVIGVWINTPNNSSHKFVKNRDILIIDESVANKYANPTPEPKDTNTTNDTDTDNDPKPEPVEKDEFAEMFKTLEGADAIEYFGDLYWWANNVDQYSAKSFDSITGMPIQFMSTADMRAGKSTFGRSFSRDILYDAPVAVIQPGAPALNDKDGLEGGVQKIIDVIVATYRWIGAIKTDGLVQTFKEFLVANFMGENSRFYGFESQYNRYIHYVNTLCHVFSTFLGINDKTIPGKDIKFVDYDDTIEKVEKTDNGLGLKMIYGSYPAMFVYYQPDSSFTQTFSNQTQESSLASKLNEVSNYTKEMSFLAGSLGIASGKGVTVGADVDAGPMYGLAGTSFAFGANLFQRIFSRTAEGLGTIVGGNNLSLPEIYHDSTMSGTEYTLNVKLVNPYGSPEGAFLYQLRQLARLLAISLPRQFGPNGYTAPFILRAFSKGEFNVQLGIVESLTIKRSGNGGENRTVHGIPMELEVTMVIKDLYEQIAISNEYNENMLGILNIKQIKLLMNNIGLLDFLASYSGYNMNQPSLDMQVDFVQDAILRNFGDFVQYNAATKEWKFPRWARSYYDSFMRAVNDKSTWLGGS